MYPVCLRRASDFHVDLEGADYILINHTHFDHIVNLKEVCERFHSTVICHSAVAMEIARAFEIPLTSIYPIDFNGRYYFDGFMLDTYHGTHHKSPSGYNAVRMGRGHFGDYEKYELGSMGRIYNVNFILNLPEGLRVAFMGGKDDGMTDLEIFGQI